MFIDVDRNFPRCHLYRCAIYISDMNLLRNVKFCFFLFLMGMWRNSLTPPGKSFLLKQDG